MSLVGNSARGDISFPKCYENSFSSAENSKTGHRGCVDLHVSLVISLAKTSAKLLYGLSCQRASSVLKHMHPQTTVFEDWCDEFVTAFTHIKIATICYLHVVTDELRSTTRNTNASSIP
ncbi:hypothetical protein JTE90_008571 [Oedothorax gibbosus]|uniref:Uncharacterized protein n=1 Tax=Oedothorax gibbosus TaxID=931172 RepID=A0AAV6TSY2_9ARAC|nr:hypothetical protein JTE90_008571 [Oedothorax gibbosus]